MTSFKRWFGTVILMLGVAMLSMGCQVLFGDFKVGNGELSAGGSGGAVGSAGGGGAALGGAAGSQTTGPLLVVPTSGLFTSDLGQQARFYVSLAQQPMADVILPIVSTSTVDGTVSPDSLTFTKDDWAAPQVVTVTGQPDSKVGNQDYAVNVGPAQSADKAFRDAKANVSITNIDNDSPGVFVTPTTGLLTTEAMGTAQFTVQLNSKPMGDVTISISSSDDAIGKVAPSSLKFTADNYKSPQIVTITGQDDQVAGDDRPYQIQVGPIMSSDAAYAMLPSQFVSVINQDNDKPGVIVTLGNGVDLSDPTRLRTSENKGTATFSVALKYAPSSDVTIGLTSSNDNEGIVSPSQLTFTHDNYAAPQTVTVTGVDGDNVADGDQPYQVTLGPITSDDAGYRALSPGDLPYVNVVNTDNDQAKVMVTLLTGVDPNDSTELITSESGTSAKFSVVLLSKPSDTVEIGVSSTVTTEGTVSPANLEFTAENWNDAKTVTVTGVPDGIKDGNVVYAVRLTAPTTDDLAYQKLSSIDVKVVNLDIDMAGITPPKLLSSVDGGTKLITTEAGPGSASFSVALTSKPKGNVVLPVTSSNDKEGMVSSPTTQTLTFTPSNYATAQTVIITGVDDKVADGDQVYTVTVGPSQSANDPDYVGLSQSVKVTNKDDDSAYIKVDPNTASGTTQENGASAKFDITLNSQPTDSVTVTATSSNTKEGAVSPSTLTFTTANWNKAQTVTVTGVDDKIDDGDVSYTVLLSGASSDSNYAKASNTLSLVNLNDDKAKLNVTPTTSATSPLQPAEAGGKVTFTVALNSQPTGNVVVSLTTSNAQQGTVSVTGSGSTANPPTLTFTGGTTGNWATPQTVTVTGVDNFVAGANPAYTIAVKTTSASADAKYAGLGASTVNVQNTNEDVAGVNITPVAPTTTCATAPGTSAIFDVVLASQPLGVVSIALVTDSPLEGAAAPSPLTFSATTWNVAQPVTITGLDDGSTGMMTPYTIVTTASSTADSTYNAISVADLTCINTTAPATVPPGP